jgi:hypothetical protein
VDEINLHLEKYYSQNMQVKVRDSLSTGVSMQIIHPSKQKKIYHLIQPIKHQKKRKEKKELLYP